MLSWASWSFKVGLRELNCAEAPARGPARRIDAANNGCNSGGADRRHLIVRKSGRRAATVAESMRDVFDIYTIIFLALAVFIFLRLRSVLGQRTGRERPPYDPYSAREP